MAYTSSSGTRSSWHCFQNKRSFCRCHLIPERALRMAVVILTGQGVSGLNFFWHKLHMLFEKREAPITDTLFS